MIDYKEIPDGDAWESFCRDYLIGLGLVVEVPPGRGADGGRDLLVREQLQGSLATRPFTWLVSCKHNATSKSSVGQDAELNIVDRLSAHKAQGFIGFYSTVAISGLIERLKDLKEQRKIEAFEIFDGSRIEKGFHGSGLSQVLLQHLPKSHTSLRPIHPALGKYVPVNCDVCGKDLLKMSLLGKMSSIILMASGKDRVEKVAFVCKGQCDDKKTHQFHNAGLSTGWDDVEDYCNPLIYIRRITGYVQQMRDDPSSYSDAAHKRMIDLFMAVSQFNN